MEPTAQLTKIRHEQRGGYSFASIECSPRNVSIEQNSNKHHEG